MPDVGQQPNHLCGKEGREGDTLLSSFFVVMMNVAKLGENVV